MIGPCSKERKEGGGCVSRFDTEGKTQRLKMATHRMNSRPELQESTVAAQSIAKRVGDELTHSDLARGSKAAHSGGMIVLFIGHAF